MAARRSRATLRFPGGRHGGRVPRRRDADRGRVACALASVSQVPASQGAARENAAVVRAERVVDSQKRRLVGARVLRHVRDRKSTRLNSSHRCISYAVFCLKKKNQREKL